MSVSAWKVEGRAPNYKVEYGAAPDGIAGTATTYNAFSGQGHTVLVDKDILQSHTWGTEAMSFEQVRALLGRITGYVSKESQ